MKIVTAGCRRREKRMKLGGGGRGCDPLNSGETGSSDG